MRASRTLTVVGCHAGGEVGNVVVGGVRPPPGETVFEQMQALASDDSLRRVLPRQPRGRVAEPAELLFPPPPHAGHAAVNLMATDQSPPHSGPEGVLVPSAQPLTRVL